MLYICAAEVNTSTWICPAGPLLAMLMQQVALP